MLRSVHGWILELFMVLLTVLNRSSSSVGFSKSISLACGSKYLMRIATNIRQTSNDLWCIPNADFLEFRCELWSNDSTSSLVKPDGGWKLVWYIDGQEIPTNETRVHIANGTMRSFTTLHRAGLLTCECGKISQTSQLRRDLYTSYANSTVHVSVRPEPVKKLLRKPVYTKMTMHSPGIVIVSWKSPLDHIAQKSFELVYCFHEEDPIFGHEFERCQIVDNASGRLTCERNLQTCDVYFELQGNILTNFSVYIVSRNDAQPVCEAKSRTWKYFVRPFNTEDTVANHDIVFIPPKASYLYIRTWKHRTVELEWEDQYHISTAFTYNCTPGFSGGSTILVGQGGAKSVLRLTDDDIIGYQAYAECVFCVRLVWYVRGEFSEPRCNRTRLHEEIPNAGPNITCNAESCPSSSDEASRNMTLTWRLAPANTWNGRLTEVKVVYIVSGRANSSQEIALPLTNTTNLNGSADVVLDTRRNYVIWMKACNAVGCGKHGNAIKVVSLAMQYNNENDSYKTLIISICVGMTALTGIGVTAVCLYRKRNQFQNTRLPELDMPKDTGYYEPENNSETFDNLKRLDQDDENRNIAVPNANI